MPKKAQEFTNNVNFRISDDEKVQWNKYLEGHNKFSSLSKLVRWCVNEIIEGTHKNRAKKETKEDIESHIKDLDEKIISMMNEQKEILKIVAKSTQPLLNSNKALREYQQNMVLNLLKEKPRSEAELLDVMDIEEVEVLNFLNELVDLGKIDLVDNKYKVII